MILEDIQIRNFGVFRGEHKFDLSSNPHDNKPIVLFGGLNGTGKTTLFEGIKICLYGQLSSKSFRIKKDYHEYLRKKILPLKKKRNKRYLGAIELNIQFNDFGVKNRYSVRRFWSVDPQRVEEKFKVLKNGKMLGAVEQEYSQAFIANLIPMGISDLFFFDGEKIQKLAEDTPGNGFFKDALDSVLGLDIIQTLMDDLKIYSSKQISSDNSYEILKEIENENKIIASYEEELQNLYQEKSSARTKLDKTIDSISRKENELRLQGVGYAKKRFEYKNRLNNIENDLVKTRRKLRELYMGLFPFTLIPDLCLQLRDHIQNESRRKSEIASKDIIKSKMNEFMEKFFNKNDFQDVSEEYFSKERFINEIFQVLEEAFNDSEDGHFYFINDFSEKELSKVIYWTEQSITSIPKEIKNLSTNYDQLVSDRGYYENMMRRVPDDSILDPIVSHINILFENKGKYEHQLNLLEKNINASNFKYAESKRKLNILYEKMDQYNKHERKIISLKNIRRMLNEYKYVIRKKKMEQLKEAFLTSIATILQKPNFINDIQIDPDTFQILLRREDGTYIARSILSSGEKQVYAISMLLALVKVSGRPLPFVIDTPLARLDSSHRDNIVENFFPIASHQVIIFSTDTEIDQMYFMRLTPYISRVYHLKYDDFSSSSYVEEGYFWKEMELVQD